MKQDWHDKHLEKLTGIQVRITDLLAERDRLRVLYKAGLKRICELCVVINPQHENCHSCEEMEERREALALTEKEQP